MVHSISIYLQRCGVGWIVSPPKFMSSKNLRMWKQKWFLILFFPLTPWLQANHLTKSSMKQEFYWGKPMMPPTLNIKDPVISLLWFTGTWSCACLFLLIHVRTLLSWRCWLFEQAWYQQGFMSPLPGACFPELWVLSPGWLWLFTQVQQDIYKQLISGMEFPLHLESQGDLWKDSWNARLYRWEELIAQSLQSKSERKKKGIKMIYSHFTPKYKCLIAMKSALVIS